MIDPIPLSQLREELTLSMDIDERIKGASTFNGMVAYRGHKRHAFFIDTRLDKHFCNRAHNRFQLLLFGFAPRSPVGFWLALLFQRLEDFPGIPLVAVSARAFLLCCAA